MNYKTLRDTIQDIVESTNRQNITEGTMNMNADRIKRVITNLRQCDANHDKIGVYTFDDAIEAIEQLRKERDEARRMYSEQKARTASTDAHDSPEYASAIAFNKGWDCYDKKDKK